MRSNREPRFPSDRHRRPLGSLRLSVTDRCNMRCGYCMPEEHYVWLPRESLLSFEELDRLAGVFIGLGVRRIRLTGGEPLLRQGLSGLVAMLARRELSDLALTTNGLLLSEHAAALHQAGLARVTVSLDTLKPDRLRAFARCDRHQDILDGIAAAGDAGFRSIKLNSVIVRGFNDDEVTDLLEFAGQRGVELRYIEYMDVGGATRWQRENVVSRGELLDTIRRRFGSPEPIPDPDHPNAPAERFRLPDGTVFGIIASVTAPFCSSCDRSRVTADGTWFTCLYASHGIDLREPLRAGVDDAGLAEVIASTWNQRTDRGAEARLALAERGALYPVAGLREDPRREMHTRGG
jgi:cyclic pyranopterin phosphate synthase